MTCFVNANLEERAQVPNVMQPSPINNIKIEGIYQNKVINALIMNKKDK